MIQTATTCNLVSAPVNDHRWTTADRLTHCRLMTIQDSPVQQIPLLRSHSLTQLRAEITGHTAVITVFIDS